LIVHPPSHPAPAPLRSRSGCVGIEPHHPAFEAGLGGRISLEHLGIMAGDDMSGGRSELVELVVSLEHLGDIAGDRENPALLDMIVEMRRVRRDDDVAET
jgi:hypothetical protein